MRRHLPRYTREDYPGVAIIVFFITTYTSSSACHSINATGAWGTPLNSSLCNRRIGRILLPSSLDRLHNNSFAEVSQEGVELVVLIGLMSDFSRGRASATGFLG